VSSPDCIRHLDDKSIGRYRHIDDNENEESRMADIQRYPFWHHLRGSATAHVRHVRGGRLAHDGRGESFWYRPLSAVISEVPVDDRELPLLVQARTVDFQAVAVQATLSYRVVDPAVAADRIDFSVDPSTGAWRGDPLSTLASLLTELAQQQALDLLAELSLARALTSTSALRERIREGLEADTRLRDAGLALVGVRVLAVRPEPDVERALQTPTREAVQQDADRALFERRAVAVEKERAISENELQSKIELAVREERLVTQRGQNERRRAEEKAAASAVATTAEADRERTLAGSRADARRLVGVAEAEAEVARLAAYRDVDTAVLTALALQELAAHLPQIGTVSLSPDLVTTVLGGLASRQDADTGSSTGDSAGSGTGRAV
jgi:hypothetical protein